MTKLDLTQMSVALAALKEKLHRKKFQDWTVDRPARFLAAQDAFRKGVESKGKALEALNAVAPPYAPSYVTLDKPFLIRAYRNGNISIDMLVDSQMQPQNSWARFRAEFTSTGSFLNQDELSFYFFWQNDAASDAVVNVSSSMMLTGHWWVWLNLECFGHRSGESQLLAA